MKIKTEKRGGKRPNAGRKPLNYKTKQLRMYVREELHDELMEFLKEKVKEMYQTKRLKNI